MPNWITETLKAIGVSDIRNIVLMLDGICILALVFMLLFKPIPQGSGEILYMALGLVLSVFVAGRNYLFGQSKSENDKRKSDNENQQ